MKNNPLFVLALLTLWSWVLGCAGQAPSQEAAIQINQFQMTSQEFEEEFKIASANWKGEDSQARQRFLENLINQKLVLQEAERLGINADQEFLKTVGKFYEQALLKLVLEKKSEEFASRIHVSEEEVERFYQQMAQEGLVQTSLEEIREEVSWTVARQKQQEAFAEWVNGLRQGAQMTIDRDRLAIGESPRKGD